MLLRNGRNLSRSSGLSATPDAAAFSKMQTTKHRLDHSNRSIDGNGAGERNRTSDLRITNALLYQLSYTGTYFTFSPSEELVFPDRDAHYGELPKKMQVLKRYFLLASSLLFDPSRKTLPPLPPIRPSSSPANLQP